MFKIQTLYTPLQPSQCLVEKVETPFFENIAVFFKKLFHLHLECRPTIVKLISEELKNIDYKQLDNIYCGMTNLTTNIKNQLGTNSLELLGESEINRLIETILNEQIEEKLPTNIKTMKTILTSFEGYRNSVYHEKEGLTDLLYSLSGVYNRNHTVINIDYRSKRIDKGSINTLIAELKNNLSVEENQFYTRERLISLFISELEQKAITDFHFLPSQINALKEMRTQSFERTSFFSTITNWCSSKSLNTIHDKIFSTEIMAQQISLNETCGLDTDQQKCLMRLEKLLSKGTHLKCKKTLSGLFGFKKGDVFTEQEKLQVCQDIGTLRHSKDIDKKLQRFLVKPSADIDDYLSYFPLFTHGLIRKIFLENPKPELIAPAGISIDTISLVKEYQDVMNKFKQNEKSIEAINAKATILLNTYEANSKSTSNDMKMTIKDLGQLSKATRILSVFKENTLNVFFDADMSKHNPEANKYTKLHKKSTQVYERFRKVLTPVFDQKYAPGCILAYSGKKKSIWHGTSLGLNEEATSFLTTYTHGAKLYRKNDKLHISEIKQNYHNKEVDLYEMLISDIWKIDISLLINQEIGSTLNDVYGNNWADVINNQYQEIENSIHSVPRNFDYINNDFTRRFQAALADYPILSSPISGTFKSHYKDQPKNFESIRYRFINNPLIKKEQEKQICSEFVSKATLASMMELNRKITEKVNAYYKFKYDAKTVLKEIKKSAFKPSQELVDYLNGVRHYKSDYLITEEAQKELISILKGCDYSPKEIDLIIQIGNREIFDLPYSKKERLKAIHPGRMVSLLEKCLVPVISDELSSLIAV